MSLAQGLIESKGLKLRAAYGAPENPEFKDSDPWTVTLLYQKRQMTIPFYMGLGHNGKEPEADNVLDCLLSDSSGFENVKDFEDWCGEYGYDTDSRRAERAFNACGRIAKKLHRLLGEDYEKFMEADR